MSYTYHTSLESGRKKTYENVRIYEVGQKSKSYELKAVVCSQKELIWIYAIKLVYMNFLNSP